MNNQIQARSEDLGCGEEHPRVGEVFAVLVGVRDSDRAGAVHEELAGGHPRIVDEGAVHGTAVLLEADSDLHRVTQHLLGSVVEDLLDAEVCEPIGAVGRELRIAEDGAGDAVLFLVCRGSLRFALTDDDGINPGGPVVGVFVVEP